jgi:hypothetical protein
MFPIFECIMPMRTKKTILYFVLFLLTIALGLATRFLPQYFPVFIKVYGGDILYATCLFFFLRLLFPATELIKIGVLSFLACIVIELQQLYKAGWIVHLRHTFPFGLILGYDFVLSDCICYAAGCLLGTGIAFLLERSWVVR